MSEFLIVVHGGAGRFAKAVHERASQGCLDAAEAGRAVLARGGSAEEAVVAATRLLEDDPTFNSGRGACMTDDETFETDAAIMRSRDMRSGAVGAVAELADPILVAQAVMEHTRHNLLVGEGARRFAQSHGVGRFGHDQLWTEKAQRALERARAGQESKDNRADTVGAVALDTHGHFAAAGSTGGVLLKRPGRVGDTPMVGAGLYAAPDLGASAATGVGEAIMTHVMSYAFLVQAAGSPETAVEAGLALSQRVRGHHRDGDAPRSNGLIAVLPGGHSVIVHTSPQMAWAAARGDAPARAGVTMPNEMP